MLYLLFRHAQNTVPVNVGKRLPELLHFFNLPHSYMRFSLSRSRALKSKRCPIILLKAEMVVVMVGISGSLLKDRGL